MRLPGYLQHTHSRRNHLVTGVIFVIGVMMIVGFQQAQVSKDAVSQHYDLEQERGYLVFGDTFFEKRIDELFYPVHGVPLSEGEYDEQLQKICSLFSCDSIALLGDYSMMEKYFYTTIPVFLLEYFDHYIDSDRSIHFVIESFSVTDEDGRRGYASDDTVVINVASIESMREFMEIVIHELGHIIDLGLIEGESRYMNETYTEFGQEVFAIDDPSLLFYELSWDNETVRKGQQTYDDFCSGYGQKNPFEDFAECLNLYMTHNAYFQAKSYNSAILAKKYNLIDDIMNHRYLYKSSEDLILLESNQRIFDTSKMYRLR